MAANTGDLEPTEGDARRSHTLRVGRYAQHFVDALQMDSNPVEYLLNKYPKVKGLPSSAGISARQAEGGIVQAAMKGARACCRYMTHAHSLCGLCGCSRVTILYACISSLLPMRISQRSRCGIS